MIFVTVGTQLPFDRMVQFVDDACEKGLIDKEVFGQIGVGAVSPMHFPSVDVMLKKEYDQVFHEAEYIISHAGMGTISLAFSLNKRILVIPRLSQYNEVVNDHQSHIADFFEREGYLLAARNAEEFGRKIQQLPSFTPRPREKTVSSIVQAIQNFLSQEHA
ncbi:MAG: hypothetical protein JXA82_01780 [Sedimentisphaerales bacterium]|nr:hypothetical protein [Sedimentisphaerales bacterium]